MSIVTEAQLVLFLLFEKEACVPSRVGCLCVVHQFHLVPRAERLYKENLVETTFNAVPKRPRMIPHRSFLFSDDFFPVSWVGASILASGTKCEAVLSRHNF